MTDKSHDVTTAAFVEKEILPILVFVVAQNRQVNNAGAAAYGMDTPYCPAKSLEKFEHRVKP